VLRFTKLTVYLSAASEIDRETEAIVGRERNLKFTLSAAKPRFPSAFCANRVFLRDKRDQKKQNVRDVKAANSVCGIAKWYQFL